MVIAEIKPSILSCISIWESNKVKKSENGRILCDYLIQEFRKRFDYELNSHFYLVSILLNYKFILIKFFQKASAVVRVALLSSWSLENFGVDYYERSIEALVSDSLVEMLKVKVKTK